MFVRMRVQSLASLTELSIRHCHKLWHRSQRQLRSGIAMAVSVAEAAALIQPLAWELPYATGVALKNKNKFKN